ncbi:MAG TPA: GH92 family glycosyl hydrolase [Nannocystaceae bacterium]|nr:GH92 family glycosyl hydrolase [Nannocystaceae bacterium]
MRRAAFVFASTLIACKGGGGSGEEESTSTTTTGVADSSSSSTTGMEEPFVWPEEALITSVDPRIGTGGLGYGVGTTNPGATVPFGMIKPGPDTGVGGTQVSFLNCTGYHYDQTHIWGFSHSRINGMGVPDYGAVLVTPTVGVDADTVMRGGARSLFDHAHEESSPGYYAVDLLDSGVHAELTSTTRVALHRYTWDAATDAAAVVLDLGYGPAEGASTESSVEIFADDGIVRGMMTVNGGYSSRFGGVPTYFAARFSRPATSYGVWDDMGALAEGTATQEGAQIGAWVGFELEPGDTTVEMALAISYVSLQEAEANLNAEAPTTDFDGTRAAAEQAWEDELHRVRVLGGSDDERKIFYTALYHSFLAPTTFSEADDSYRGFDGEVHQGEGVYYSDFSLWDTYRTLHPLLNFVQRDRSGAMMASLVRMYEEGGDLPMWPLAFGYTGGMVGTPADIVIADAHLLEVPGFDADVGYRGARLHANEPRPNDGRPDIEGYIARGYVANDVVLASVSNTLEFSQADAALSNLAKSLQEHEDAQMFKVRADGWRALYNSDLEFVIGRNADASFVTAEFDPLQWGDAYAEGTAWHYLWAVPHDAIGLAALLGGEGLARERLDTYFEMSAAYLDGPEYSENNPVPYYWHSNEPSLHVAYLFTEWSDPSLTQKWVDWARRKHYDTSPAGLPGNDDAGTMSAWYVWAAIGLYPLPAHEQWWITAPIFERIELNMGDADRPDRKLEIISEGTGIYVAGASFDGVELIRPAIDWETIRMGGTLRVFRSETPTEFGQD